MRGLPFARAFDAVTMFFTSFGYFGDDEENAAVIGEVARVLRPGGRMLLDYVNRDVVIETLVPESDETVEGNRVLSRRCITSDGKRVEKDVRMERPDGSRLTYTESVRLYSPDEMRGMVESAGFAIASVHGGPDDVPFEPTAPRFVIVGRLEC
jgi:SAM-dependent methyltransferase